MNKARKGSNKIVTNEPIKQSQTIKRLLSNRLDKEFNLQAAIGRSCGGVATRGQCLSVKHRLSKD